MKKGLFVLICGIVLLATTTRSSADDLSVHASNSVNYTIAAYSNANQAYTEAVRLARFKTRTSRRSFFGFGRRRTTTVTVAVGNDYPNTEWGRNYTYFGQYYAALARDYARAGDRETSQAMAVNAYYYLYTAYQYEVDIAANGPDDTKPWAERAIPLLSQALAYISQLL